jgi:ubiquinone/menaquinone biosynthesis C-methylase UbiE
MPTARKPGKNERPSTYFVQGREKREELTRLTIQGRMLTLAMGGPLPEQTDPTSFQRVLDVACGPGDWVIDTALAYPAMSLVGIDISQFMIDSASAEAVAHQLSDRISFRVMDALAPLEFPDESFDLVNQRLGASYLRTWDWPKLLIEFLRITRPGGTIRLTDSVVGQESNSAAATQLFILLRDTLFRAGHLFEHESTGLTAHLAPLLTRYGCQDVQVKTSVLEFRGGTPEGEAYYQDLVHFQTLRPFLQKWGVRKEDFDAAYHQALKDARQSQFWVRWRLLSAWGTRR